MAIIMENHDGKRVKLIKTNSGIEVNLGDELIGMDGNKAVLQSAQPPQKPSSTGRVWVKGRSFGYYPSVYDLSWVPADQTQLSAPEASVAHGLTEFDLNVPDLVELQAFNGVEVDAVALYPDSGCERIGEELIGKDPQASYFWSVYLRCDPVHPDNEGHGGAQCVGDFPTKQLAFAFGNWLELALQWAHSQGKAELDRPQMLFAYERGGLTSSSTEAEVEVSGTAYCPHCDATVSVDREGACTARYREIPEETQN